ncbi:MAG TPA: small ribosomal subunit Rsm22 family protein, partial [Bdellovibrio sp.]|nr:small ribosomal subunit Rsm22 family protein [Bdellovibrio sp.]
MTRIFGLSKNLENNINEALRKFNLTLGDSKVLAKNVMMLSDFFIKNPEDQTPWHEAFAQIAYLCYYLPLNSARLLALIEEAEKRNFFEGMNHVIDFGAGLATASLNLAEKKNLEYTLIERAAEPRKIIEAHFKNFQGHEWLATFNSKQLKNPRSTIALFSYSLTELTELPAWAYDCEALFIVEPSTQQDGRKLLQLREHLLQKGFHVWAPCTHEAPCPLLSRSKNDWCHDR